MAVSLVLVAIGLWLFIDSFISTAHPGTDTVPRLVLIFMVIFAVSLFAASVYYLRCLYSLRKTLNEGSIKTT